MRKILSLLFLFVVASCTSTQKNAPLTEEGMKDGGVVVIGMNGDANINKRGGEYCILHSVI